MSKNIFVGVMRASSPLDNYVGADRGGWGYLANKAIWHNKGKACAYGELFKEGDTIGVCLDLTPPPPPPPPPAALAPGRPRRGCAAAGLSLST